MDTHKHGDVSSKIDDHPFVPRGQWWSLCKICGLAMPAHTETIIDTVAEMEIDHKRQQKWREIEQRRLREGGRARIGYYSDDNDE